MELRDYQQDIIGGARNSLRRFRRVLVQAPTGAGKTVLASYMAGGAARRGVRTYFLCHRAELVAGTSFTFGRWGIPHGLIAAGEPMDLEHMVQVCSIDTLRRRLDRIPEPGLALWDEAHHLGAASWAAVMDGWTTAKHVGLSATPWRLDGGGLDAFFEDLVLGPSTAELIDRGALSDFVVYAPQVPDMGGVAKTGGDFTAAGAAAVMMKPKLVGDIVAHWRERAAGLRTVGFACKVDHSLAMVAAMQAAGIRAAHLDGDTPKDERARVVRAYADGELEVLWNVALFGEGFDLAAVAGRDVTIDAVIQARPTTSLSLHLQQVGRALRPAPGKRAVILDHAGNAHRHGLPDDARVWTLAGRAKGGAANDNGPPPPVTCAGCFGQIRRPMPDRCPYCGHKLEAQRRAEEIKVEEGRLIELARGQAAAEERARKLAEQIEVAEADSLDALVAIARKRGYRFPMQWAQHRWGGRMAKKAAKLNRR
jgi:superfamily II DNA or RNA helicase